MAYVDLQKVVLASCEERADSDYKTMSASIRYANDAVRELVLMTIPILENLQIRSLITPINESNFTVFMPQDFVYATKVGICCGGRVFIIDYDETLCFDFNAENLNCGDCTCSCESEAVDAMNTVLGGGTWGTEWTFYNTYRQGGYVGEVYGVGGAVNAYGFYKYFKKENMMVFRNIPANAEVIVEYKSDGIGNGVTLIPSEAEMAVRYYIKKLFAEQKGDRMMAAFADANYQRQVKILERIYSADNKYGYRNALLQSTANTVRR